ncbi:helix-turn-helix transcriptional regulator [Corallococcus sp. ZKHCc1 1396]|uniref:Helix-turn-helix transcriptional regulator n=1 Tax=Corallococcus soli TaxID=2710757 RepID=A0ABR9PR18_9BACT|nr:helix-turn-helix domain-containing protein [Corallococcus soli]MBE4750372.1 helix-turn-helix transcriptional regulator [Corallococcus soli]MCY1032948.1 helix-turn-helix domain-containing protein [Corallococcus sp. BB11-1]RYZ44819.1 MAG: transcriptional regulator [Myxococcaceae bacterium]
MKASKGSALLAKVKQRGDLYAAVCPSRGVLEHLTSRWGVLVLIALREEGTHRFSELRRKVGGVSEKMLAQTLQALEQDGFVLREAHPVIPPHVDYSLTPLGQEVAEHVKGLTTWIEDNLHRVLTARTQEVRRKKAS